MKRTLFIAMAAFAGTLLCGVANASWLSEITGVHIDLNRGTMEIKPPNPAAIGPMLQNLPKDVSQVLLNPAAPAIAESIRWSRAEAFRRGVQPIPPQIRQYLQPYFPPQILDKVRWTTAGGISIDGALKNWFNQEGAVTFDDVIVFSDARNTENVALWAHELTHVLQYQQMGIDTFAFQYMYEWNGMEQQARDNSSHIVASIDGTSRGMPMSWGYQGSVAQSSQQLTWGGMNQVAMSNIPAQQCIWIDNQRNMTGNNCPVAIRVAGVVMRRLYDGAVFTSPCIVPTCILPPNQSGPLLSPPGFMVIGVTAAYSI
ncbi:eCIS core domain-containing protein [Dyella lutea]|uniref:DUF4157 domain-containing protein n=1 Tax=Dyella lutea TaxID=2950441 RepID=A0ABT1F8K9_9GAMM|nr:DUF4157 domain-containing protein [Dyella lutea]MCP1372632.1 DUF4157 domain-containing protein [Dyella lutea]